MLPFLESAHRNTKQLRKPGLRKTRTLSDGAYRWNIHHPSVFAALDFPDTFKNLQANISFRHSTSHTSNPDAVIRYRENVFVFMIG